MTAKELVGLGQKEGRTKEYIDIVKPITGKTLLQESYLFRIFQSCKDVLSIPGDVAEVGVYKGGSTMLLSKSIEFSDKTVHAFDTFTGMPPADSELDIHVEGDFSDVSLEEVQDYLKDCNNIKLYPGFFPDTAEPISNLNFCLVYIDCDIYTSVLASCEFFYPRLSKGGMMIFDDYGLGCCPGATLAINKFFADKPEKLDIRLRMMTKL